MYKFKKHLKNVFFIKYQMQGFNHLWIRMYYYGTWYNGFYYGFNVENEIQRYRMSYTKTGRPDSLQSHNGMMFTTTDSDNDLKKKGNCADNSGTGWWYSDCMEVNLNGIFASRGHFDGIVWKSITGHRNSLGAVEMLLRQE